MFNTITEQFIPLNVYAVFGLKLSVNIKKWYFMHVIVTLKTVYD